MSGVFYYIQNIGSNGAYTTASTGASSTKSFSSTGTGNTTFSSTFSFTGMNPLMSGNRAMWFGAATSLSGGEYWFGLQVSTAVGGYPGGIAVTAPGPLCFSTANNAYLEYGSSSTIGSSNTANLLVLYSGVGSTTTTAALSNFTIQSGQQMWFNMVAQTK